MDRDDGNLGNSHGQSAIRGLSPSAISGIASLALGKTRKRWASGQAVEVKEGKGSHCSQISLRTDHVCFEQFHV